MFFFRVLELEEQIKKEKDQADLLLEQQRVVMLLLCLFSGALIALLNDYLLCFNLICELCWILYSELWNSTTGTATEGNQISAPFYFLQDKL